MTDARSGLPALSFDSNVIRDRGDMLSLTDMWRAAGSQSGRGPSDWLAGADATRFVEFLSDNFNAGISGIELVQSIRGGSDPGTWAHWQIGLAYAKYLSPEFHAWCNSVVRSYMEGISRRASTRLTSVSGRGCGPSQPLATHALTRATSASPSTPIAANAARSSASATYLPRRSGRVSGSTRSPVAGSTAASGVAPRWSCLSRFSSSSTSKFSDKTPRLRSSS